MSNHSPLGPSSAHRWINCPGSLRMAKLAPPEPEEGSPFAVEGTIAHSLAELYVKKVVLGERPSLKTFKKEFEAEYGDDPVRWQEMHEHAKAYAEFVMERAEFMPGDSYTIHLEERVKTGIEGVWGTADCVIVGENVIEVIDFKYGSGVPVSAERNPQLLLYGKGALETFGSDEVTRINVSIFQPRVFNGESTYSVTRQWLDFWCAEVVAPAAREALSGHGHLAPSASNCRWCPAAGFCKARAAMELRHDFDVEPEFMTGKDLAEVYPRLGDIEKWTKQVKDAALHVAEDSGLPGYKVVEKRGSRKITNPDEAIDRLQGAGYDFDSIAVVTPRGITELRKLVGDGLDELLGDAVEFKGGGPSLVKENTDEV